MDKRTPLATVQWVKLAVCPTRAILARGSPVSGTGLDVLELFLLREHMELTNVLLRIAHESFGMFLARILTNRLRVYIVRMITPSNQRLR